MAPCSEYGSRDSNSLSHSLVWTAFTRLAAEALRQSYSSPRRSLRICLRQAKLEQLADPKGHSPNNMSLDPGDYALSSLLSILNDNNLKVRNIAKRCMHST